MLLEKLIDLWEGNESEESQVAANVCVCRPKEKLSY